MMGAKPSTTRSTQARYGSSPDELSKWSAQLKMSCDVVVIHDSSWLSS
jgi:hypothetical protein